jgi:hypothetical protein
VIPTHLTLGRAAWRYLRARRVTRFLPYVGAVLAAVAIFALGRSSAPPPKLPVQVSGGDTVRVPAPVFNQNRPDTTVGRIEGITAPPVQPTVVIVSEGAGAGAVSKFCAKPRVDTVKVAVATPSSRDSARDSMRVDTVPPPPAVLANGIRYRRPFLVGTPTLDLYLVRNDGDALLHPYRPGPGSYSVAIEDAKVVVQRDRFGTAKVWAERGIWATFGGAVVFVALGGGR